MDQVSLQTMNYANVFSLPLSAQPTLEKILDDAKTREDPSSMSKEELVNLVSNLQVEMDELEEEMQELRSQLLSMTQFDSLTGLPSRGHFMVSLRQEVARARRYERPLSLVILDMDEFTEFNAKHGQTAGDVSLQSASLILQKVVRDCDFLARSGGDEFAVVLPETDSAGGRLFAERVRACMESLKVDVDGKRLPVSACVIGINLNSMPLDSDHEVFYAAALRGVKKLRQRGPNRVSWVDPRAK
jgi:diguanylate cyclase (GGDEF)-like protein